MLGGVDKFEQYLAKAAWSMLRGGGELAVSGCNASLDCEAPEYAFDAVALFVEGAVVPDRHAAA